MKIHIDKKFNCAHCGNGNKTSYDIEISGVAEIGDIIATIMGTVKPDISHDYDPLTGK